MTDEGATGRPGADPERAELEHLRSRVAALEAAKAAREPHHRWKSFFAAVLIIIGCVLAPLAAVAAWASSEIGDTNRYVQTVAPLASDPDIQAAAANRVTNAVMEHIDIPALLEGVAPTDRPLLEKALGKLGNSLESAVRSFVHDKAQDVIASDTFARIWTDANRRIHTAVVKALTGSGDAAVKIKNDSVTVDLGPVVDQVKQRLVDEGMTVASKIPEVHTDFTVLRSDDIGKVKTYFRLLQLAGTWLPVLSVLLVAAGVLLSRHRRRVLVTAALAFAFATLMLGVGLTVFRVMYLNGLPDSVSQPAAESVYDALTRYLRTTVRMTVVLGVVIALAAWLSGPGRWATLVRQVWHSGISAVRSTADRAGMRTGPVGPFVQRHRGWITWVLVAAAVLTFVLWSYPTGLVILVIALVLLFAMAVAEFLAEDGSGASAGSTARAGGHEPPAR
ncbi:hypothetical protein OG429_36575 [Streptomyces sp. NBC_00190]|uniref:hypothetical protein n=1 Tax=unclassified Streptomyces TaxID=2593676 RepID=UPI002E2AE460|nr:hypothetical protein [Streptomyces sp. NBC_00190]WSZ44298.1 hypothetical protein OG239_39040 [Streptomyces sp. NBC_00868]